MNQPRKLTKKQAEKLGMKPLVYAMKSDDPHLFQAYKDMQSVAQTEWAIVAEGKDRFSIWRIPRFYYRAPSYGDDCRGTGGKRRNLKTA